MVPLRSTGPRHDVPEVVDALSEHLRGEHREVLPVRIRFTRWQGPRPRASLDQVAEMLRGPVLAVRVADGTRATEVVLASPMAGDLASSMRNSCEKAEPTLDHALLKILPRDYWQRAQDDGARKVPRWRTSQWWGEGVCLHVGFHCIGVNTKTCIFHVENNICELFNF